jgi:hypothetical protein
VSARSATSPLDPRHKRDMLAQQRKTADKDAGTGRSVVVTTHDVDPVLINLNVIQGGVVQPGDELWTHDAAHWLTAMGAAVALGMVFMLLTYSRPRALQPRRE